MQAATLQETRLASNKALKASPPTGRSEHELITEAKDRFKSRHGRKFGFVCLWQSTLRHEAQWMITEPNFGQIDDEEAEDSDLSSDTTEEEAYDEETEDSDLSSDTTEEEVLDQGGRNTTRSSKVRGREQYHSDSEDGDGYADDMHDAENERKRLKLDDARLQLERDRIESEVMEKDISLLPDDQAREFFRLKKQSILSSLQAKINQPRSRTILAPKSATAIPRRPSS
ncbi:hypothetical protein PTTG_07114 [Puccinia triticina 1-1 BBBD Race 1]|uniref:NAM-associated domain-containing protein n=1 Tax=Puccinia triticina (isolate 1-1 / race 1 (BBBD)) TaxID=630390 RepID=A0A0C4F1Z3_PUCT1|nr:hypothetical protein PTTG_07114 [Puccinia triticina 1-1 BBBD Race 1]